MLEKKPIRYSLILAFSISGLALSACSTQGSSRYGDVHPHQGQVPCGTIMVPCGVVIEYHPVQVTPPPYLVPVPCPTGQCPSVAKPEPPVIVEPPVVVEPPVITEPPVVEPPIVLPPPPSPPPPISCPEGTIPGYGGTDCIPITVPRK